MGVGDIYIKYFYLPLQKFIHESSLRSRIIQGGNINVYISYIFVALIITLFVVL